MKKLFLFSIGVILFTFLSACGDTYDKEGYDEVENYSDAMIPEAEIAAFALADLDKEDFNNDEKLEEPDEYIEKIEEINHEYWEDSKLAEIKDTEMKNWRISMSHGEDEEWTIKGDDLADAVYGMKDNTHALVNAYKQAKKDNNDKNLNRLNQGIDQTNDKIMELREIIYNK